jgi:hypothetical protein
MSPGSQPGLGGGGGEGGKRGGGGGGPQGLKWKGVDAKMSRRIWKSPSSCHHIIPELVPPTRARPIFKTIINVGILYIVCCIKYI